VHRTHDEITLPMPGHSTVSDLCRPLSDGQRIPVGSTGATHPVPDGLAPLSTRGQAPSQILPQPTAPLHVQRLIDRLVAHPSTPVRGMLACEHVRDELRRPPIVHPCLYPGTQTEVVQLVTFRPSSADAGPHVGQKAVIEVILHRPEPHLSADRR